MKLSFLFAAMALSIFALNTNNALAQWYQIPQMQDIPVTSFLVLSDSTLFVAGHQHSLYRSTDGGETWLNMSGGIPADTILSLASAARYIFAGTSGGVYRSSDTGGSWQYAGAGILYGGETGVYQFASVDSDLYVASDVGVYRSTDFGESWAADNTGLATGNLNGRMYTLPAFGIVSADSSLFVTQDLLGGAHVWHRGDSTWSFAGLGSHWCDAGALIEFDTAIFAGVNDGIFLYSGHDTTWLPRHNGLPEHLEYCMFAAADSFLFAFGGSLGFYVTSDLGETWSPVASSVFGGAAVNSIAASKNYLYAGTASGAWRIPLADIATSVKSSSSQFPGEYMLYQNFPNPFNPSTVIRYQMAVGSRATLKVYDVLGREIATLVDGEQVAGAHAVTFNAAGISTGTYFYRFEAGRYSETKKFVVIK